MLLKSYTRYICGTFVKTMQGMGRGGGGGNMEDTGLVDYQGVKKRCRLSLLTNSTLVIRVQMRGEGGSCGVSANENSCTHHVTWSPNKLGDLPLYLTYVDYEIFKQLPASWSSQRQ
jgi:hypothetical protein